MTDLVVGCPVAWRDWIFPEWFAAVHEAVFRAHLECEFVFVTPRLDASTISVIKEAGVKADVILTEEDKRKDVRVWSRDRFEHMAKLRNMLLARVRQIGPRYFWSLDSDILPAPDALAIALSHVDEYDAIGMRTYMTSKGTGTPSVGHIRGEQLVGRFDMVAGCFAVDCIMASKVMTPKAYWVDYRGAHDGEDVGWCLNCATAGLKLGWCAEARCKHVMKPALLNAIDERVGF